MFRFLSALRSFRALREQIFRMLHVAMPGIVRSFDPLSQTADILPCRREKGIPMPVLCDVPVFFPGGASSAITWPVQPGDECLLIFADTDTDGWYLNGTAANPDPTRNHSLSDAFAFVGFRSRKNALSSFPDHPSFFGIPDKDKSINTADSRE